MSTGLTSGELSQIREVIAELLPDTAYVLSLSTTQDAEGNSVESWGTAGTADCRLDFGTPGEETLVADSIKPFQVGMLSMAYNETLTTAQRVSINTNTYSITGVNNNQSWIGVKRATVQKL